MLQELSERLHVKKWSIKTIQVLEHLIRDEQPSTLEIKLLDQSHGYKSSFPDVVYNNTIIYHFYHSYEPLIRPHIVFV